MSKLTKNMAVVIMILMFISGAYAQQPESSSNQKSDDFVTEKGFKSKVFDVRYRDANAVAKVLRQLGSGFKGATISSSSEFKTLTVRDFPENIATIEEALKRLDTPTAPAPNIEWHMHVLVASESAANVPPKSRDIPAELTDVITQLSNTFKYRNYELGTSVVQRLTETQRGLRGKGTMDIAWSPAPNGTITLPYDYLINSVTISASSAGAHIIEVGEFAFSTGLTAGSGIDNRTQVQTALNLRDGEKVVVGTSTLGNRALIVVLTAKLVK